VVERDIGSSETEYFGVSDAISIPNLMKIDGIDHQIRIFPLISDLKVYQAHRNFH
jgi:hypothetical protein